MSKKVLATFYINFILQQGVQLYIEIHDTDNVGRTQSDEFIDFVLVDHNSSVGETSQRQNHAGMFGFVMIDLSVVVMCARNFQGADCTQCRPDFTGPNCTEQINDCVGVDCGNGVCMDGIDSFSCICDPGFTGELCQANIDECVGVVCSRNGQCVDGVNNFQCVCDPGFTGELCQTNIDDCVGVNCTGNGQCVDGVNSFTCDECIAGNGSSCTKLKGSLATSSVLE